MSHNDKIPQTKKSINIPFPKNFKKTRVSGVNGHKIKKDAINKSISKKQNKEYIIVCGSEIKTRNKLPPKTTREYVRGKSMEKRRKKKSPIPFKKDKINLQLKLKINHEISYKKDLREEINGAKKEIVDTIKTELRGLKNILINGFQCLFSLLKNDNDGLEEKRKQFEKSIEITNNSNGKFKLEKIL